MMIGAFSAAMPICAPPAKKPLLAPYERATPERAPEHPQRPAADRRAGTGAREAGVGRAKQLVEGAQDVPRSLSQDV